MAIEQELKRVLRYEPETGLLYWTDLAHKAVKGRKAAERLSILIRRQDNAARK